MSTQEILDQSAAACRDRANHARQRADDAGQRGQTFKEDAVRYRTIALAAGAAGPSDLHRAWSLAGDYAVKAAAFARELERTERDYADAEDQKARLIEAMGGTDE